MADNRWTSEQSDAISTRGRRLLVSAAAGSGKTAVLVERIIGRILDPVDPVDVDELLVITFTRAAAAEMKERIRRRLEEAITAARDETKSRSASCISSQVTPPGFMSDVADPGKPVFPSHSSTKASFRDESARDAKFAKACSLSTDVYQDTCEDIHESSRSLAKRLREQLSILESAHISTIDSFCMDVVRDHTDELDIDPGFRVAQETELKLMQEDVMEELLEECYEKADEDFIALVDAFGSGNTGDGVDELIQRIYRFAQVTADPQKWYEKQIDDPQTEEVKTYVFAKLRELISSLIPAEERLLTICASENGPAAYAKTINSDIEKLDELSYTGSFEELHDKLHNLKFDTLARNKGEVDPVKLEAVKKARGKIKETVTGYAAEYTREDISTIDEESELTAPFIAALVKLAREYDSRYSAKKREKNVVDFCDLEHMALKVLNETDEYKNKFREICVDEYQDTNELQESLVRAIDNGQVFMVGDVKQSIYKFRQARPEIFMQKYETFGTLRGEGANIPDDCSTQKCGSADNRGAQTCTAPDTDALINLSRNFRSRKEVLEASNALFRKIMRKEVGGVEYGNDAMLNPGAVYAESAEAIDAQTELLLVNTESMDASESASAAQARMIAAKIKELTDAESGVSIYDKGTYRRAKLSDIVILLRSSNKNGDEYVNTLLNAGIKAHCDTNKGYFDSLEVRTMIAMLSAIDNPRKEIEMAAFLHSPVIGMTDDELAVLKKKPELLSEIGKYKYNRAMKMLADYRAMSRYMPIEDLITKIYDETSYYEYAMSLSAGKVRKANLDKLRQMAAEYAATGYKGLFNFLRYIENLKTYDTDFGEAQVAGENDDAVRIMSIHKSKGLEFPIVFVAECHKRFNQTDSYNQVLIDADLGIADKYVDLENRMRERTFKHSALRMKLESDTIGEELRILYVAMTRAKEKLFLTAAIKDEDKFIAEYDEGVARAERSAPLPVAEINSSEGYLYWIKASGVGYKYTIYDSEEKTGSSGSGKAAKIRKYLDSLTIDPKERDAYAELFDYEYPYADDVNLRNKISISELKKKWMIEKLREDVLTGETEITDEDIAEVLRAGSKGSGVGSIYSSEEPADVSSGAARGTLYHEVMEKLDYTKPEETLGSLPEVVKESDIRAFVESDIGSIFLKAQTEGRLYREKQFIMGLPAREIGAADSDEPVLVQGIIDAFVMSEDGKECMLVDYKTDRVSCEEELITRYEGQLHYYARAIEMMRGCKVTKKIIWSFALGKAIEL